jgi:hypothetical protein
MKRTRLLVVPLLAPLCLAGAAVAGVAPNPGGAIVVTNSTTSTFLPIITPVTDQVIDYSTTITALLDGSPVYSATFAAPFSDPTVQAAVAQADLILSGDGATYGAPGIVSGPTTVLQSSVTPAPVIPAASCSSPPAGAAPDGNTTVTTATTFGPAVINVGDCQSDTFTVLAGQEDININTDNEYTFPVSEVTTDTYLTSSVFDISGLIAGNVPEPAGWAMMLTGIGFLGGVLRRRGNVAPLNLGA